MDRLDKNWLTNGLIDFEYKKYILLSYLTHVQKQFEEMKLFPALQDIHNHFDDLKEYKQLKHIMNRVLPKEINGIDADNFKFTYVNIIEHSDLLKEIDAIVDFAVDAMSDKVFFGKTLLDYMIEQVLLEPIGISPIDKTEGYLFFYNKGKMEVEIYKYRRSLVRQPKYEIDEISTCFLTKMRVSLVNTVDQIKKELLKTNKDLPNPATFLVNAKVDIPWHETLMPITKKILIKKIAA